MQRTEIGDQFSVKELGRILMAYEYLGNFGDTQDIHEASVPDTPGKIVWQSYGPGDLGYIGLAWGRVNTQGSIRCTVLVDSSKLESVQRKSQ